MQLDVTGKVLRKFFRDGSVGLWFFLIPFFLLREFPPCWRMSSQPGMVEQDDSRDLGLWWQLKTPELGAQTGVLSFIFFLHTVESALLPADKHRLTSNTHFTQFNHCTDRFYTLWFRVKLCWKETNCLKIKLVSHYDGNRAPSEMGQGLGCRACEAPWMILVS